MGRSRITRIIGLALGALSLGACTTTSLVARAPVVERSFAYAPPPAQFTEFCRRNPGECSGQATSAAALQPALSTYRPASRRAVPPQSFNRYDWSQAFALPAERVRSVEAVRRAAPAPAGPSLRQLADVNRLVNDLVRFRSDDLLFGAEDFWALPVRDSRGVLWGDCEDYALMKRSILISRGYDASALSLAMVRTQRGDVHAVLIVSTDAGEMVLDSLSSMVTPWRESRYRLIARQASGDTTAWLQPA